jgi:hypothetical protein
MSAIYEVLHTGTILNEFKFKWYKFSADRPELLDVREMCLIVSNMKYSGRLLAKGLPCHAQTLCTFCTKIRHQKKKLSVWYDRTILSIHLVPQFQHSEHG